MWDSGTTRQKPRSPGCWKASAAGPTCRLPFNWRTPVARPRRRYRGKGCRSHPIMQTAGRRSRRLRSRTRTASTRRSPSTDKASRGCVKPSLRRPSAPRSSVDAVRAAFPADHAVTMRVSGTDWVDGGWDIDQTIAFAQALEARGCAAIHVSSGGLTPSHRIPGGPSYQVPLARAVKRATRIPVIAVGLITEFEQAEAIVGTGDADLIALARTILYNPRWPWHAGAHFGAHVKAPDQYLRSQPRQYPDLFDIGH